MEKGGNRNQCNDDAFNEERRRVIIKMGRSVVTWTMDDLVFLVVRFFSFKNLVYLIIFAFALPLLAWIFVAKNEPSMDFAAAMEMQVKYNTIQHRDSM